MERIVVIVMENRTPDNLLGALGAPGTAPAGPTCGPLRLPPDNRHAAAVAGLPHPGRRCRVPAAQVPLARALLRGGCQASRHFSEILGPSDPNDLALMAAASPIVGDWGWFPSLPPLLTLADRMDAAGLPWRNYAGNVYDGLAVFPHLRGRPEMGSWRSFEEDALRGRLARLSWLTPPFSRSQHPPLPVAWGEQWLARQVAALARGPGWPELVAAITWDDWGGFWDHASPPPMLQRWHDGTPFRLGLRTPLLLVGGRVAPRSVYAGPCSHASIPALVGRVFGLPPLTAWDAEADDLTRALLPPGAPATGRPLLPALPPPRAWSRALQCLVDIGAVAAMATHVPRRETRARRRAAACPASGAGPLSPAGPARTVARARRRARPLGTLPREGDLRRGRAGPGGDGPA